jgi:uncharacterized protein YegP (UPF0339 family)
MRTLRSTAFFFIAALASVTVGCAASDADDLIDEDGESSIPATMDLWETSGQWHFNLVAGNGNILLSSEAYTTRLGALNGMLSVLDNGGYESMYTAVKGTNGKYHLVLKAANGEIIATTQQYSSKSSATRGIGSCARGVSGYLAAWETNSAARAQVLASDAGWRFNIYAANGQIVLTSESYTDEAAALNGAFSVVDNGKSITAYEVRTSTSGKYYFVVKASNGQVIGTSQQYTTKASAESGRNALIALLPSIELL